MTTTPNVILSFGKRKLDLMETNVLEVQDDYFPPSTIIQPLVTEGTSANRFGGGIKRGERGRNRSYTFTTRASGDSEADVQKRIHQLTKFLSLAGSSQSTPLFLQFRGNSDVAFEPTWGQYGANFRYEIVHSGPPTIGDPYPNADCRADSVDVTVTIQIKPFAEGIGQPLASALGGVLEDTIGWQDGFTRGTIIPQAVTNEHTNPVFGNATFNTSWTDGANLTDTENTDEEFVLFGVSSAKLTTSGGGTDQSRSYTESITLAASAHELSYYVKLPDGGTISATRVSIIYNGFVQTTVYTPIGDDGWFRLTTNVTGSGGAADTGITVADGFTIYLDGTQAELGDFVTPLSYGDLLGNVWDTVAQPHNSSSTRAAARLRIPTADTLSLAEGTIRVAWRVDIDSADLGSDRDVFQDTSAGFRLFWRDPQTDWRFSDGTNTADGAVRTHSIGDIIIFHCVFDPVNGLILYINGAEYATNATYTPAAFGADLYIGTNPAAGAHLNGVFHGAATYPRAMTAQEVSDDFDNITQWTNTADPQRLEALPYLWTKDGDGQVDNCDDESTEQHYAVIAGIPGSEQAVTVIQGGFDTPGSSAWQTIEALYLSNLDVDEYFAPEGIIYTDQDGVAAGGYCGGEYTQTTVDTTALTIGSINWDAAPASLAGKRSAKIFEMLNGKSYHLATRLHDSGSDLTIASVQTPGLENIISAFKSITTTTDDHLFLTLPQNIVNLNDLLPTDFGNVTMSPDFSVLAGRSVAGSADVRTDWVAMLFNPLIKIVRRDTTFSTITQDFLYKSTRASLLNPTSEVNVIPGESGQVIGPPLEFVPNKVNILQAIMGNEGDDVIITWQFTYLRIVVTPRYSLL